MPMQAARDGKPDSKREALKAQMAVLHLRSRIQKALGMQVCPPEMPPFWCRHDCSHWDKLTLRISAPAKLP